MTSINPNIDPPLTPEESDILDLVEGRLPEARAIAVRARLARDPSRAAWVTAVVRDKAVFRSIDDVPAPAALVESVETSLEREALLGLSTGRHVPAPMPITRVYTQPRWPKRLGVGLAAAAGLALAATGLFLYVSRPTMPSVPDTAVATNDADAGALPNPDRLASDDDAAGEAEIDTTDDAGAEATTLADAAPTRTEPVFFTSAERAAELLAEGRLLIRVRAADPESATERVERLAHGSQGARAWRLLSDSPESVRLAVADALRGPVDPTPLFGPDGVAFERVDRSAPHLAAARGAQSPPLVLYLAETRTDRVSLAVLLATLSAGDRQQAVFEELPEPIHTPPVVTPEAVLWWAQPPSAWTPRAHVPIVVEHVGRN